MDINRIVRMGPAIDDVHHRHRQNTGRNAADIFVQRQGGAIGSGLGHGQRHAQYRIGPQTALIDRAV